MSQNFGIGKVLLCKNADEIAQMLAPYNISPLRGQQIYNMMYKQNKRSIEELSQLPWVVRDKLIKENFVVGRNHLFEHKISTDFTQKALIRLYDGKIVEAVGIPSTDGKDGQRLTACISSQVGCPMKCSFCATGKGGFSRNLMPFEILDQVLHIQELFKPQRLSNIVFMGMGEPLLNIPSVARAFQSIRDCCGISARNITISTVGVPNSIQIMAALNLQCNLAISLHAPTQELRESIVPSAKAYPIRKLIQDCQQYFKRTGRRITFEYAMMKDVNDQTLHAELLINLLKEYDFAYHVNLIPYNPVDGLEYQTTSKNEAHKFESILNKARVPASVRRARGTDINAACGQLLNEYIKKPIDVEQGIQWRTQEQVQQDFIIKNQKKVDKQRQQNNQDQQLDTKLQEQVV